VPLSMPTKPSGHHLRGFKPEPVKVLQSQSNEASTRPSSPLASVF
jgi:hypothetical protein